ncbi:MAG: TonB-dependent receptor [Clostridium sp.]|nr:TonB-dependent receptor [Clostridium sp.]
MNRLLKTYLTILGLVAAFAADAAGSAEASDTLQLGEVSVTAIKQSRFLGNQAVAYTTVSAEEIRRQNIVNMKDVSEIAPNFYIPAYGSRMTSSIYVRGIGARIDQPVVGLNVDNVPFLNKDNYDFDLTDIARIEILRGPQSTLYGRNTMGGLVNIYTLSPFVYQGGRVMAEGGNGPMMRMSVGYYHRFSARLAMSWNANFNYVGGYYRNEFANGEDVGMEKNFAARWKICARPSETVTIENIAAFGVARQGGYPYAYKLSGEINYNDTCFYRRNSFSDGLTVNWDPGSFSLSSITSLQTIDDNMTLDQDFLPLDYFTLTQKRREWAVTQDFVGKGSAGIYSWLGGLFGFYRHTSMDAPVTFKGHGIKTLIEDKRNEQNPDYPVRWRDPEFVLGSHFTYPVAGAAVYHRSSLRLGAFTLDAGFRLDYEHAALDYRSTCSTAYDVLHTSSDGAEEVYRHQDIDIDDRGHLSHDYLQFLPKFSATWHIRGMRESNLYASVAKGYKSGGFNTQMFSDVLQQRLMRELGLGMNYDIDDIVGYKPEKSWNYEVGAHVECGGGKVVTDLALFYIDCRDQQLTMFPDGTTTGRITTNAGKTRSIGGELSTTFRPSDHWTFRASYGFTDARFVRFYNGKDDFAGKRVPYAPRHTLFAGLTYGSNLRCWIDRIEATASIRGVGSIYWDEENTSRQGFYATGAVNVTLSHRDMSLSLWCENLTNTRYDVFSFKSIGNEFVQRGLPRRYGVTLRVNFESGN